MRIVSKIKDFYDYLVGKWGQDEKITYVRDGERLVENKFYKASIGDESCLHWWGDSRLYGRIKLNNMSRYTGSQIVLLWIGDECIKYDVNVHYDDNGKLVSEWKDPKVSGIHVDWSYLKRESDAPVVWEVRTWWRLKLKARVENPILIGTKYAGLVDPEKMWLSIYNYILRKNNEDIVDNRTNDEKIECAGFDKKTSFRNCK